MRMSLLDDKTAELWRSFMIDRHLIGNAIDELNKYSIQVYDQLIDEKHFNPRMEFTKWAAVEVHDLIGVPENMDTLELPGGKYAVFLHKGLPVEFPKTAEFIFGTWLPGASFKLDKRPHFEVLGPDYKNNHPESEEEVWIPVRTA